MVTTKAKASPKNQVSLVFENGTAKVFFVDTQKGKFTVFDYEDRFSKKCDTEIYYTEYTLQIKPHTFEYKEATTLVNDFLRLRNNSLK